jgi:hypothetical protein
MVGKVVTLIWRSRVHPTTLFSLVRRRAVPATLASVVVSALTVGMSFAADPRPAHTAKQSSPMPVHGTWTSPVGACFKHVTSFDPTTGVFTCTGTSVWTGTWIGSVTWTVKGHKDPASGLIVGEIRDVFKGHARRGRHGTLTFVEQLNQDATGRQNNPADIVRSSGGLAGSRGHVRFIGQANPDGSGSGTYSGRWRPGK